MTTLSPLDALGPAFRRTREVLGQPFRFGFFLKIALVAALTQPSFYSSTISYPIQGVQWATLPHLGRHSTLGIASYGSNLVAGRGLALFGMAALIFGAVLGFVLWIGIAYLYCRLRFTLFDLVVYKRGRVGQAWSGYGRQAWRYFGLVILVSLAFMVVTVIVVGAPLLNFIRAMRPLAAAGPTVNPFALLGAMLPFLLAIFAVAALWAVVDALMQDFLLPPLAVEDAPLESAFRRFFALLRTNFWPVVGYVLLRFAVGLGLTWILMLLVLMGLVLAGLAIFGVGTVLYHAFWASLVGQVVCVALGIAVGLVVSAFYLVAVISVYGISAVFKQSYAVYFFGGRYAALGDRLEPPPPGIDSPESPPVAPAPPPSMPIPPLEDAPPVW